VGLKGELKNYFSKGVGNGAMMSYLCTPKTKRGRANRKEEPEEIEKKWLKESDLLLD